jgi:SPX domain protein involved in polyphosphate accumulation
MIKHLQQATELREQWMEVLNPYNLILIIEDLTKTGGDIDEIIRFQELNLTTVRKSLKKFDKCFKAFKNP